MPARRERDPRPARRDPADPAATAAVAEHTETPFAELGEWLRRAALGLTAALVTARPFFPSEDAAEGTGLAWVLAVLVAAVLAVAGALIGGTTRLRWSWTDAAFVALVTLVALSATYAVDRRPALNLAWEWVGLGVAYLLARNLPRTRGESTALAGTLTAVAVAVSAYGLFQVAVEYPMTRKAYFQNPRRTLHRLGLVPGTPQQALFENRLVSNEPMATFALTNSLAGFLVGPAALVLAVIGENLRRGGRGPRSLVLAAAAVPLLVLLACLLLTKSRSAYAGLALALAVLAWRQRRKVPPRALVIAGAVLAAVVGILVVVGAATGQLDRLVVTETGKSLHVRGQYWNATWQLLKSNRRTFLYGLGPGNFAGPYLKYRLETASEAIRDPHNLVLDVWTTAGLGAACLLLVLWFLTLRDLFGPSRERPGAGMPEDGHDPGETATSGPASPPPHAGWLIVLAGAGGWLGAAALGWIDPILLSTRWLILGVGWLAAVVLGVFLWRRFPLPAAGFGAGVLAVKTNLLGAGGIGIPSVALGLWTLLAVGLNLREDRPCGRLRVAGGRGVAYLLAVGLAALLGVFVGTVGSFWAYEAAMADADAALRRRPPDFKRAENAYLHAIEADRSNARPWIALSDLERQLWETRGARFQDPTWRKVFIALDKAVEYPLRNPESIPVENRRAAFALELLSRCGGDMSPGQVIEYRALAVKAYRHLTRLDPTNAEFHAQLALTSGLLGMAPDAAREAKEALRLDAKTPHLDRKLPRALRERLQDQLPEWEEAVRNPPRPPAASKAGARKPR